MTTRRWFSLACSIANRRLNHESEDCPGAWQHSPKLFNPVWRMSLKNPRMETGHPFPAGWYCFRKQKPKSLKKKEFWHAQNPSAMPLPLGTCVGRFGPCLKTWCESECSNE